MMAAPIPMDRATVKQMTRVTRGGRKLTYVLRVIQQPERARACGSGAKSSSDRRPVDPPPVVELRIYHQDGLNSEDITFSYEANFFLFATLEAARSPSRGRSQSNASSATPVLTGMPVSGMAYLDRPIEAGYFIYPDLSVRHEGHYVLNFNLYEEAKNDYDQDIPMPGSLPVEPQPIDPDNPDDEDLCDSSFDWRMDVKSSPFTVYSAKKFPGLSESTHLSRIVAEQGCRVRIRRDARMRRRGEQKSDELMAHDDYYCQDDDNYMDRSRSPSPIRHSESNLMLHPEDHSVGNEIMAPVHHNRYPPTSQSMGYSPFNDEPNTGMNPLYRSQVSLPRPIQPPILPSPYGLAPGPSSFAFDTRPFLSRDPRDYNPDYRRTGTNVASYSLSSNSTSQSLVPYHRSPQTYQPHPPLRSLNNPASAFRLPSPIRNSSLIHHSNSPMQISNITNDNYSSTRNSFPHRSSSSASIANLCHPQPSKRTLDVALPSIGHSGRGRLLNGKRPLSPDLSFPDGPKVDDKEMVYKRASGSYGIRRPQILSQENQL